MAIATERDIRRIFPGIEDHTVLEVLDSRATIDELEAAALLLGNEDEGTIGVRAREGALLNRLLDLLSRSDIQPPDDTDL